MIINDICDWNAERGNIQYNVSLEFSMLTEEVEELILAKQKNMLAYADVKGLDPYAEETFTNMPDEDREDLILDIRVDEADALADIVFVAIGGLYKLTGCREDKVEDILKAVIEANNNKGKDTKDGKIVKPKGFVGPEEKIRDLIEGEI